MPSRHPRACTARDLNRIEKGISLLKQARDTLRAAGAKQTTKKVRSALKSAGGARRHCQGVLWYRNR